MEEKYVAFFDSGVGGLTLLSAFCRAYPGCPTLYFGDNANAPYGDRPAADIRRLALAAFDRIAVYPVRAAAVACNTVTAACIGELRRRFPFPVVGVEPAVRPAVAAARGGRVLLLCTRATLAGARVRRLLSERPDTAVVAHCPARLAAAVEENLFRLSSLSVDPFLPPGKFDAAVLGCTHYVWLRAAFERALGCPVFDGTAGTLRRLAAAAGLPPPQEGRDRGGEGRSPRPADRLAPKAGTADRLAPKTGTADHRAQKVGTAAHPPSETGTAAHRAPQTGTAAHRAPQTGTAAHHISENTNDCSKNGGKIGQKSPVFLGPSAKFDARAYRLLQK